MPFPGPRYYIIRVFSSNTPKKLSMLPVTATSDRPGGRSMSWRPRRFTAAVLVVSALVSLWLFTQVFWDRLGGDSRAFYTAARVDGPAGFGLILAVLAFAAIAEVVGRRSDFSPASGSAKPGLVPVAR